MRHVNAIHFDFVCGLGHVHCIMGIMKFECAWKIKTTLILYKEIKTKAPPNNFDVKNVEYICLTCLHGLRGRWFRLLSRLKPSMLNAMCQLMMVTSKHNLHYFRNIRNWNYLFLIAYILKRHVVSSWQAHDGWQAHDAWDALRPHQLTHQRNRIHFVSRTGSTSTMRWLH